MVGQGDKKKLQRSDFPAGATRNELDLWTERLSLTILAMIV